jgi:hypothetical protein
MGDTGIRFGPSISSGVNLATRQGRMAAAHQSSRALMGNPSRTSVIGAGEMMGLIDAMAGANQIVFDWMVDENGNLVADIDDNAATLAQYLRISESEALNMLAKNGVGSVKVGDVVRTGSFNLQEITVTAEKIRYGVVNGIYGKLNADPTAGDAFATAGSKFTADLIDIGVNVVSMGTVASAEQLLILGAKSQAKRSIREAIKKIEIQDADKIDRKLLNPPSKKGNAPTFKEDGTSVEIHHVGQNPNGPFKEMHKDNHRGKGVDVINHRKHPTKHHLALSRCRH